MRPPVDTSSPRGENDNNRKFDKRLSYMTGEIKLTKAFFRERKKFSMNDGDLKIVLSEE